MKKVFSVILAVMMICAITVPAFASVETGPSGGSTELIYNVASNYFITIPDEIIVTNGTGAGDYGVLAGTLLESGKKLVFTITESSDYSEGFRLKNTVDDSVFLGYTITKPDGADTDDSPDSVVKDTAFFEVPASDANAGKTVTLTYTTDAATIAGSYIGTVTVGVALANITP